MLPTLKTSPVEFRSARAALDHLEGRVSQRISLPLRDLRLDPEGRLSHIGALPVPQLQAVPIADGALKHLNDLVSIPSGYAARIDPDLHCESFARLAAERLTQVTAIVERDRGDGESQRVVAVVRGASCGIEDEVILRHLDRSGVPTAIVLEDGAMSAQLGELCDVEVFPSDAMRVCGALRNGHWSNRSPVARPSLDISVFAFRLICSNGMQVQRSLSDSRLLTLGTESAVGTHLRRQLERVLAFPTLLLKEASAAMREDMPSNDEHNQIAARIARHLSFERARDLLKDAVSWWDHANAITAAANLVRTAERRLELQIEGGRVFDEFIARIDTGSLEPGRTFQRLRSVQ